MNTHLSDDNPFLLSRLKQLTESQLDELIYEVECKLETDDIHQGIPYRDTQSQKCINLIRLLRQKESGLDYLQRILDDFGWFGSVLPEGIYPVGPELFKREEQLEKKNMKDAKDRGEDPEGYRITPEKFYTFKQNSEWLGVFRDWDCHRSFHLRLVERATEAIKSRKKFPAVAITGTGGSGKSIALKRLAVDLNSKGYNVWWVEESCFIKPQSLLSFFELCKSKKGPIFIMMDEIHKVNKDYVLFIRRKFQDNPSLILVVAGRSLPSHLGSNIPKENLFVTDKEKNISLILKKIAEIIPDWQDSAKNLEKGIFEEARLIHILVVLARRKAAPQDLEELEEIFYEILAYDIDQIYSNTHALALAVLDAAFIRTLGYDISLESLILLASSHDTNQKLNLSILLGEIEGNPRWKLTEPLLSCDSTFDAIHFHHEELARGVIHAGERGLCEFNFSADNQWKKATLDFLISHGSVKSASNALAGAFLYGNNILNEQEILKYINGLIKLKNGHQEYLKIIISDKLNLSPNDKLNLLFAAVKVAPINEIFWGYVWKWIQNNFKKKDERMNILKLLSEKGCQAVVIVKQMLKHLPRNEAKEKARELIENTNITPKITCVCLNILGEKAKEKARELIENTNITSEITCVCLNILGEEAKEKARELLEDTNITSDITCVCLNILGEEAKEKARELIENTNTTSEITCVCLNILGEEAKEKARELLENTNITSDITCVCLNILGEEAKEKARELLEDTNITPKITCVCLNILGEKAKEKARELLEDTNITSEITCACLSILGEEALSFCKYKLNSWNVSNRIDSALIVRCFQIAGLTEEAEEKVKEMLGAYWDQLPSMLRICALRAPFNTLQRETRAIEILENWHQNYRPLVAAALTAFWDKPEKVTSYCSKIISRWHQEIVYRHKRNHPEYDGHIIKALSHPFLRRESRIEAQKMKKFEERHPGFLSPELNKVVNDIVMNLWLPWYENESDTLVESDKIIKCSKISNSGKRVIMNFKS